MGVWKELLRSLVKSFVFMDPLTCAYFLASYRAEAPPPPTAEDDTAEREVRRLIERLEAHTIQFLPESSRESL